MRRIVLPVLAAVAALGLTAPAAPAAPVDSVPWGSCPSELATPYPQLTCATMPVPLDYARPAAGRISLAMVRVPARDPAKRRGVLFVNNGGPGASPFTFVGNLTKPSSTGFTRLPAAVLDAYDVVTFDPRGVGRSAPISCVDPDWFAGPKPDPDAPENRAVEWSMWQRYAESCGQNAAAMLPHIGTRNVARDIDSLRAAMGEGKMSVLGFSYGTYLATVYATLFPARVDRMVLDGNLDPGLEYMYYQTNLMQDATMYSRRDSWFDWVARYDDVFGLGTTRAQVRAAWDGILTELRIEPRGGVGPNEFIGATFGSMYSERNWTALAQAMSDYVVRKDDAALLDYAAVFPDPAAENSNAVYSAVSCLDAHWPANRSTWESDAAALHKKFPFAAWYNTWNSSACQSWPVPAQDRVVPTGAGLPPILMLNNLGDPATPHAGAVGLHRLLPSSVLVSVQSGAHCEFANRPVDINPTVNQIAADYLTTGKLPAGDITVAGHALPVPTAASATRVAEDFSPSAPR